MVFYQKGTMRLKKVYGKNETKNETQLIINFQKACYKAEMGNQHVVTRSQHLMRKWTDVFGMAQKSKESNSSKMRSKGVRVGRCPVKSQKALIKGKF